MFRIHIKSWPMVLHTCNPSMEGETVTLACSVSFKPMKDPVSEEEGGIPGCPMISTCMNVCAISLTYTYRWKQTVLTV